MQSKQKMLYLPEAQTDFIYAIVGRRNGVSRVADPCSRFCDRALARVANVLPGERWIREISGAQRHGLHRCASVD